MSGINNYFSNNNIFNGTEIPTQGKFDVGDIIVNIGENAEEEPMWMCIEAGEPGVWKVVGKVEDIDLSGYQEKTDENLATKSKDLVGAINELFQNANNGKELIANAIGEPLSSNDTFSAMSDKINNIKSDLKQVLTDEGVSVNDEDNMDSLIAKVDEEFDRQVVPAGDAVAANVLSGKTFINSTGQVITGNMTNRGGAQTITPGTSNKTLNAGYYSGNITVKGDSNLVAANIVSGKSIFGVTGTATASSLGGKNFASGTCNVTCGSAANTSVTITTNLSFKPSIIILFYTTIKSNQGYGFNGSVVSSENYSADTGHSVEGNWGGATFYITNISSTSFKINATLSTHMVESTYDSAATFTKWFAIG